VTQGQVPLSIQYATNSNIYAAVLLYIAKGNYNKCVTRGVLFLQITVYGPYSKSNYKVYVYIVKHNYILGGILFTIRKAQLHVSALNVGHLYSENLSVRYTCICRQCIGCREKV
jgi:hypothetical protein